MYTTQKTSDIKLIYVYLKYNIINLNYTVCYKKCHSNDNSNIAFGSFRFFQNAMSEGNFVKLTGLLSLFDEHS